MTAAGVVPSRAILRPLPYYQSSSARGNKKLLQQEDCWQLLEDSKLVPSVINTLRFNKVLTQLFQGKGQGQGHTHSAASTSSSVMLSFYDFQRLLVGVSQGVTPVATPTSIGSGGTGAGGVPLRDQRMVRLIELIEQSGLPKHVEEESRYD